MDKDIKEIAENRIILSLLALIIVAFFGFVFIPVIWLGTQWFYVPLALMIVLLFLE